MRYESTDARLLWQLAPEIVCSPQKLNFGEMDRNGKQTRVLYVHNLNGPIPPCSINCCTSSPWLRATPRPVVDEKQATDSLELQVEVDPSTLAAGQSYMGWMEIQLEPYSQRIAVEVAVHEPRPIALPVSGSHWLKTFGLTVAAILLVSMLLSLLSSERIGALTDHFFPTLSRLRPWPDHHQLGFATHDGKTLTLQLTTGQVGSSQDLALAGWSPVWSSDGTQLAFLAEAGSASALYMMDVSDETPTRLLSSSMPKSALAWAPDGHRIALLVGQPGEETLTVVNSRGWSWNNGLPAVGAHDYLARTINTLARNHHQSDELAGFTQQFVWSPDGSALLFDYYQAQQTRILLVDANGDVVLVAEDSWHPTWSPDGTAIAAVTAEGLLRMAPSGEERHYLTHRQPHTPAWSPDGRWIAFRERKTAVDRVADHDRTPIPWAAASARSDLWVIAPSGQHERLLAEDCVTFAWSPDGQQLAYVTGDGRQETHDNAQQTPPLYYLWTIAPDNPPTLIAEVNSPTIAWKRLP